MDSEVEKNSNVDYPAFFCSRYHEDVLLLS